MRPVVAALMILSACAAPLSGDDLRDRLAGRTLILDRVAGDDPSWPPLRWTFGADGSWTGTSRSVMQPHRPHSQTGYWWVDGGRLCRGGAPQGDPRQPGVCYDVTLTGDRFEGQHARDLFRPTLYFTLPPRGVLVD